LVDARPPIETVHQDIVRVVRERLMGTQMLSKPKEEAGNALL
jgi:hypothetical protein